MILEYFLYIFFDFTLECSNKSITLHIDYYIFICKVWLVIILKMQPFILCFFLFVKETYTGEYMTKNVDMENTNRLYICIYSSTLNAKIIGVTILSSDFFSSSLIYQSKISTTYLPTYLPTSRLMCRFYMGGQDTKRDARSTRHNKLLLIF